MSALKITINNFNLLHQTLKALPRVVDCAKITINSSGLSIKANRAKVCKVDVSTNAVTSDENVVFSILDLNMLSKVFDTIKDVHDDDYTDLHFTFDSPFLKFSSKKFKTKISTCSEDIISLWIWTPLKDLSLMTAALKFTTTSDFIRRINSHSYIYGDSKNAKIYLESKDDMQNNTIFASIGNRETNLNNEMTLKFGLINEGFIPDNRHIIFDLERLQMFNAIPSDNIEIVFPNEANVLISKVRKEDSNFYMTFNLYNSLLKA